MNNSRNIKLYIALGISAGVALIYQVAVSNILFYYFPENSYSVATVLSTFMIGLALGSFLYHKVQKRVGDSYELFGWLQFGIALYAIVVFYNASEFIPLLDVTNVYIISFLILLVPTTALGAVFPLSLTAIKDLNKTGLVYGVDLVGAAIGSLLAGFYLLPNYGNKTTILVAAVLGLISAGLVWNKWLRLVAILVIFILIVFKYFETSGNYAPQYTEVAFEKNSPYGLVEVREGTLYIDKRDQCSWKYPSTATERSIVTEVFSNFTKRDAFVLNIGLGCGLTLEEILEQTTQKVDVVEINGVVVEANMSQTSLLENEQINLIIEDGVQYVRQRDKRYDAVVVDITNPAIIYSSNLFTAETFNNIHENLVDNGVFGLWVNRCNSQLYNDIIYNTLKSVFENAYQLNDNIFIASDRILPYRTYVPYTDTVIVNTKDTNHLAREYYENCRFGDGAEFYIDFK